MTHRARTSAALRMFRIWFQVGGRHTLNDCSNVGAQYHPVNWNPPSHVCSGKIVYSHPYLSNAAYLNRAGFGLTPWECPGSHNFGIFLHESAALCRLYGRLWKKGFTQPSSAQSARPATDSSISSHQHVGTLSRSLWFRLGSFSILVDPRGLVGH